MTKQEKINAIYEKVANKELRFGCKIKIKPYEMAQAYFEDHRTRGTTLDDCFAIAELTKGFKELGETVTFIGHAFSSNIDQVLIGFKHNRRVKMDITPAREYGDKPYLDYIFEMTNDPRGVCAIIGHPVIIGDVLEWIDENQGRSIGKTFGVFIDYETELFKISAYWDKKRLPIENQSEECIEYLYNLIK